MNNAGKKGTPTATDHMKKCQVSGGKINKIIQKDCRQMRVCGILANCDVVPLSLCKKKHGRDLTMLLSINRISA